MLAMACRTRSCHESGSDQIGGRVGMSWKNATSEGGGWSYGESITSCIEGKHEHMVWEGLTTNS